MKVNLETIVDAVEMSCDSVEQYYHIPTGEVVTQFEYDYDEEVTDELEEHWYGFLEKAHRNIAIEWCEENNIEYEVL